MKVFFSAFEAGHFSVTASSTLLFSTDGCSLSAVPPAIIVSHAALNPPSVRCRCIPVQESWHPAWTGFAPFEVLESSKDVSLNLSCVFTDYHRHSGLPSRRAWVAAVSALPSRCLVVSQTTKSAKPRPPQYIAFLVARPARYHELLALSPPISSSLPYDTVFSPPCTLYISPAWSFAYR